MKTKTILKVVFCLLTLGQMALADDLIHCERTENDGNVTALRVYSNETGYQYSASTTIYTVLVHRRFPTPYASSGAIQRVAANRPNEFDTGTGISTNGVYRNTNIQYNDEASDVAFSFKSDECSAIEH